ncbi:MAG: AraC family transcriptional regulator [Phycisphaerales bacterium]|jgi:AraC-like DNA-binding protein|nr:AraC family transcriptional regulator [Phycisphaerales bacterium]
MPRVKKSSLRPKPKLRAHKPIRPDEVPKLEAAMRFVRKNFANGIDLHDAADVAGISRFHFLRRFKLHFGKTAKAVAAECQIEAAKRLLLAGTKSIRVFKVCGFAHQSHFCAVREGGRDDAGGLGGGAMGGEAKTAGPKVTCAVADPSDGKALMGWQ